MKLRTFALAATAAILAAGTALAEGDLTRKDIVELRMEMGTKAGGKMYFEPNHLEFETGKAYKLVMVNVDKIKHEVALEHVVERVFTRKVEVVGPDGKMLAEIKGHINEVELAGGATAEWFFVPLQPVKDAKIACEIPGHEEAGMWGTVTIK